MSTLAGPYRRDSAGRFDEKPQSAPESTLRSYEALDVASDDEPFSDGVQLPLFPANWSDDDFAGISGEPDPAYMDAFFDREMPDATAGDLSVSAHGPTPF